MAIAAVKGNILTRFDDQPDTRADFVILAGEGAIHQREKVNAFYVKTVIAQPGHDIDILTDADLVLNIGREEFDIRNSVAVRHIESDCRKNGVGQIEC